MPAGHSRASGRFSQSPGTKPIARRTAGARASRARSAAHGCSTRPGPGFRISRCLRRVASTVFADANCSSVLSTYILVSHVVGRPLQEVVSSTGPTTANRSLPCDRGPTRRDRGQRHPAPDSDRGVTVPADSRPGTKPPAFFRRYREDRTVRSVAGTASGRRLRPGTSERGRSSLPARRPRAPSGGGWSDRTPPEPARPAMLPIPRAVSGVSRQARARIDLLRQPRRPPAPAFVRLRPADAAYRARTGPSARGRARGPSELPRSATPASSPARAQSPACGRGPAARLHGRGPGRRRVPGRGRGVCRNDRDEDYFRILKSGCKVEQLQHHSAERPPSASNVPSPSRWWWVTA